MEVAALILSRTEQRPYIMPPVLELLGGILNILQIVSVIRRHVKDYCHLDDILKSSESKAKRIEANVRIFQPLHALDGLQSQILGSTVQEFANIRDGLIEIQEKVASHAAARNFLSSLGIVQKLSEIDRRLAAKDDILKIVAMICALNVDLRTNCARIVSLLTELTQKSPDISSIEARIAELYQMKMIDSSVCEVTVRRKGYRIDQMAGYMHLSAGENLYNCKHAVKDFAAAAQHFHAAEKLGWSQAYYYLGMLYKNGLGVERCDITCSTFFQKGSDASHPAAISQLAVCYDEGIGVLKSPTKSAKLIKRAAEAGDPYGMSYYAFSKLNGHNTDVNLSLACNFASKASKKGYGKSTLARCYEHGIRVERDPVKAIHLYSESISEGSAWTCRLSLARCYERGDGIDIDLEKAATLYEEGSKLISWKRPYFQGFYGLCLIRGRGVQEDEERGWDEVQKSIQGGNATGWYVKGECYRHGYGVGLNLSQAVVCYRRAIQMKNGIDGKISAKFALGNMYELGQGGLSVDLTAAFQHYKYAAKRMHQEAQWKAAILCESGIGVHQYLDRAVYYFGLAANSGHRESQLKASKYYMKGKGVSRDLHTAVQLLRPAAERGDKKAKQLLRRAKLQIVFRQGWQLKTRSTPPTPSKCFDCALQDTDTPHH